MKKIISILLSFTLILSMLSHTVILTSAKAAIPNSLELYDPVIRQCMEKCTCDESGTEEEQLCRALFLDLNNDGTEELILQYSPENLSAFEVWMIDNGEAICVWEESVIRVSENEYCAMHVTADSETRLAFEHTSTGSAISSITTNVYAVQGEAYPKLFTLSYQNHYRQKSEYYYLDWEEISKEEYDEKYANIANGSELFVSGTELAGCLLSESLDSLDNSHGGTCGENVFWNLSEDGTLTISGTGAMDNHYYFSAPSYFAWRPSIKNVVIESGVTTLGSRCFYGCENLVSITIPESVTSFEQECFFQCSNLTAITIPENVTHIARCFEKCNNLKIIKFDGNAPDLVPDVFNGLAATAYYSYGNETWTEDVMKNYGGYITWVSYYDGTSAPFSLQTNAWSFVNAARSFVDNFDNVDNYKIPKSAFDAVYGSAYGASKFDAQGKWEGNCAGMSTTAVLFHQGNLNWDSIKQLYTTDFPTPNSYWVTIGKSSEFAELTSKYYVSSGSNSKITDLIERYQLCVGLNNTYSPTELETYWTDITESENQRSRTVRSKEDGGTYIASMLSKFQQACETNTPLLINLVGQGFGHTVVARTDREPENQGDGWWRVYIYDPNRAYINDSIIEMYPNKTFRQECNSLVENGKDVYMELNPDLNIWRYYTAVNADEGGKYIGTNAFGNVKYIKCKEGKNKEYTYKYPEFFWAYSIERTFAMNNVDVSNGYGSPRRDWMPGTDSETVNASVDYSTNCVFYTTDGNIAAIVENGQAGVLIGGAYASSNVGLTADGTSLGSTLVLPNQEYRISYTSGIIEVFGNNNVTSITAEIPAEIWIDSWNNAVEVESDAEGVVKVKCANVFDRDTCSFTEAEGTLTENQTFTLALDDQDNITANTDNGPGSISVEYKDSQSDEAEHYETLGNPESVSVTRLSGSDRHETAFKIADMLKSELGIEKFSTMIIASGADSADALAGSYLAARVSAPILLSRGNSHARNLEYIQANLAEGGIVYILGGTAAVPEEMENLLKDNDILYERLKGKTRFDTNLAILDKAGIEGDEILVSTGYNFADSLSASASGKPILLVHTNANVLTDSQKIWLENQRGKTFTIIGGTGAVSEKLEAALAEYGPTTRLKGSGREATSVEVAKKFFASPDTALLAYSRNFPDGLCGGPLAYAMGAPLLLVNAGKEADANGYVNQNGIRTGYILGGTGVISDDTARTVFGLDGSFEIPKQ